MRQLICMIGRLTGAGDRPGATQRYASDTVARATSALPRAAAVLLTCASGS